MRWGKLNLCENTGRDFWPWHVWVSSTNSEEIFFPVPNRQEINYQWNFLNDAFKSSHKFLSYTSRRGENLLSLNGVVLGSFWLITGWVREIDGGKKRDEKCGRNFGRALSILREAVGEMLMKGSLRWLWTSSKEVWNESNIGWSLWRMENLRFFPTDQSLLEFFKVQR
jgi:hypothetical protein